jgi:hypothetical protein
MPEDLMSPKPPRWTDVLLTIWIVVVGLIYFGGYFVPAFGVLTGAGAAFYALMVLISALVIARRYLHRSLIEETKKTNPQHPHTNKRK